MTLPDKVYIASLDIDVQKSYTSLCPTELPIPDSEMVIDELNAHAQFANLRIGSKDAHCANADWVTDEDHPILTPIDAENMDKHWPPHCIVGTTGFESIDGLPKISEYDFFVWKGVEPDMHPYGCCYHDLKQTMSTGLIEYLNANKIQLILCGGLITEICIQDSVLQLLAAGFQVIVNLAACKHLDQQNANLAIQQMRQQGARIIQSSKELKS